MRKGELYPLSFLFGPEEKKIRNGKKERKEGRKEGRARGSFPFQICIRACCMEKPSKRGREKEGGRRWLNRAAAASVCVLKNGDYDLGQEYFDPDLNRFQPKLQALLIGNLFTPSVRRHFKNVEMQIGSDRVMHASSRKWK